MSEGMDTEDEAVTQERRKPLGDVRLSAFGVRAWIPVKAISSFGISTLGFIIIAYMLYQHNENTLKVMNESRAERMLQIERVSQQQRALQDNIDVLVYVISLPEDQRSRLNLAMPDALRTRLLDQERGDNENHKRPR